MKLHEIKSRGRKHTRMKRAGRGPGSGLGKTAGRGHKGQKSRPGSFGSTLFAGGQTALFRRLPKRGFTSSASKPAVVNIGDLNVFSNGATVDISAMKEAGLVRRNEKHVKVLACGALEKKLTVVASAFSEAAVRSIEESGGIVQKV